MAAPRSLFFFFFFFLFFYFICYSKVQQLQQLQLLSQSIHAQTYYTPKHTCNSTITTQGNAYCYFTSVIQKRRNYINHFFQKKKPCQNCHSCIFETKENSNLRICINYLGHHSKTTCQKSAKSMRYLVRPKFKFYRKSLLTVYMYMSRNPGPYPASSLGLKENCIRSDSPRSISFIDSQLIQRVIYTLSEKSAISPTLTPTLISVLKNLGLFRACGLKIAKQSSHSCYSLCIFSLSFIRFIAM